MDVAIVNVFLTDNANDYGGGKKETCSKNSRD